MIKLIRQIVMGMVFLMLMIGMVQANAKQNSVDAASGQAWGTHGMAVFGGEQGLYASHLPMFHAPHDMQVIIRFHLSDKENEAQLRRELAQNPELWTLDPEEFDLSRLQLGHPQALQTFSARFVQGHFERGGKEVLVEQTVIVDQVVFFHRLSTSEKKRSAGRYMIIGSGQERFLVKAIDRRPDFDVIIKLKNIASKNIPKLIRVPSNTLTLPSMTQWRLVLSKYGDGQLSIGKVLYFETDDLR